MVIEEFYKTFGIEPKKECYYWDCPYSTGEIAKDISMHNRNCKECKNPDKEVYPPITDKTILELICLHSEYDSFLLTREKFETLKNNLLLRIITLYKSNWVSDKNKFKKQVQNLLGG